jgi:hypothetical protein
MSQVPPGASGAPRPVARPPLVTAAAVVLFVAGGLNVLGALFLFSLGSFAVVWALISLIVGAAAIYAGVQIMALREQGRMIGLILSGVAIIIQLVSMIAFSNFFGIISLLGYGFVIYALVTTAQEFHR